MIRGKVKYHPSARFAAYLFSIAHRRLADRWRRLKRVDTVPENTVGRWMKAQFNATDVTYSPVSVDQRSSQKAARLHAGDDALLCFVESHPRWRSTRGSAALSGAADSNSSTQATNAGAMTVTMERPTAEGL